MGFDLKCIKEINVDEKIFRDTRTQIGILKSRGVNIKNKKIAKRHKKYKLLQFDQWI